MGEADKRPEHSAEMTMKKPHVLIAGAGIGGLTAALALLRRGIEVDVYEQAPELGEVGAGVHISANGTAVLFALGLEESLRYWGMEVKDRVIRLWNTGQTWSLFGRQPQGGPANELKFQRPNFALHRRDLHKMLVDAVRALKADAIHLDHRCTGFKQDPTVVELHFEKGRPAQGDVLVGADGIRSPVRAQLFGTAAARFTGQVVWRGLAPMHKLPPQERVMRASNWIGPRAHVTCYPVHRGELYNFVGQTDRADWQVESWIVEGTVEECLSDFRGWHPEVLHLIETCEKLYKWGLFLRDPMPRWSEGRVTLLGDACHAMLPYLGQGANTAIEDGYLVARCLDGAEGDIASALKRYEAARRDRTTRIVQSSAEMAEKFHDRALADPSEAERYINSEWHPDKVRARYQWIYNYDAINVAV
jgi:salicylate hydroxylase